MQIVVMLASASLTFTAARRIATHHISAAAYRIITAENCLAAHTHVFRRASVSLSST
jgi:hypothetical protein